MINPLWLPLTIFAYVALAISGVVDKIIVGQKVKSSAVVSFYVSALGVISVWMVGVGYLPVSFAATFKFAMPSMHIILVALVAGVLLQLALWSMYGALKKDEATRVISAIGAINPIATLFFAYYILGEKLQPVYIVAFIFLLVGAVVISVHKKKLIGVSFELAATSAILFALQSVLAKYVYDHHHFISGFIIITLGGGLYAIALALLHPAARLEASYLIGLKRRPKSRSTVAHKNPLPLIILNTGASSVGVMALNIALSMGPASLINALRGVQYAAIFVIAVILSAKVPKLMHETLSGRTIVQKLVAVVLISVGVILLASSP